MHLGICLPKIISYDYIAQFLAAFIVSVGYLLEGMHYGWSSSAVPQLSEEYKHITEEEIKYIIQMFTYGSLAYNVLSFADYPRLNEKFGVIASVVVMTMSWVLIGCSNSAITFMIARFFAGAGREIAYQISLNYICEIADPAIRGFLGCLLFIMTNLGVCLIYFIGSHLNILYCSLIGVLISFLELIALKWVPESPYILLLRGKTRHARIVLQSLRNLFNVENELDKVTETVRKQDDENSFFLSIFTVSSNRKSFCIILILNAFQGLVGIQISIRNILKLSGGNFESNQIAMVSALINVLSCTLTALFVDYVGRKCILIISFLGSGFSLVILGSISYIYNVLHIKLKILNIIPVACLLTYTMVYRMGIAIIPVLLSGELFPMNVKNTASCFTGLFLVGINFVAIVIMDWLESVYGSHVVYWICSVNCLLGTLYTCYFVPETSRKTLDEIQFNLKAT